LAFHAADHVEGSPGLAAQGHFEQVFPDARFDGLAQLGLDLEEPIGRTEPFDALVRTLVVVILDPDFDALPRRFKTFELGAGEELLPEAFPEALDLAQGHGMMRAGFEVGDAILSQLGFEARSAAPTGVLAAIVGEHLFGRFELGDRLAVDLDDGLRGGAAEQIGADDETGVIIEESDHVGVTAAQTEGEDVRLPHLVGGGPFEEAGPGEIAPFGRRLLGEQTGLVQFGAHRFGAGLKEKDPAQPLGDAFDAEGGVLFFQRQDLIGDGGGQPGAGARAHLAVTQAFLAIGVIAIQPLAQGMKAQSQFLGDGGVTEAFFEMQPDSLEFDLEGITPAGFAGPARHPPGGVGCSLLLYRLINFFIMHGNTPFNIGVSTIYPLILVS
jgi:hypothetical protein